MSAWVVTMGAGATMGSCIRRLSFHPKEWLGPKSITWASEMAKHNSGVRMRLRWFFRLCFPLMRDIIIDLPIEGHHPPDRAHGDILSGQETPDAELASIGMGF